MHFSSLIWYNIQMRDTDSHLHPVHLGTPRYSTQWLLLHVASLYELFLVRIISLQQFNIKINRASTPSVNTVVYGHSLPYGFWFGEFIQECHLRTKSIARPTDCTQAFIDQDVFAVQSNIRAIEESVHTPKCQCTSPTGCTAFWRYFVSFGSQELRS